MAGASLMLLLLYFSNLLLGCLSSDFLFNGFNESNLILDGATITNPNGALQLTNDSNHVTGHAFYPTPIRLLNSSADSSSPSNVFSFSTTFVFFITSSSEENGGYGLAFTLSKSPNFEGGQGDHFLGILNEINDGNLSNHVFLVEFDTVDGLNEGLDSKGNHIGVSINSMKSNVLEPASYFVNGTKEELSIQGGKPIQVWIDYDGLKNVLNVTISPLFEDKPTKPLISSKDINLTSVVQDEMYAGFSAATGDKASYHYILEWSFSINNVSDPLDLQNLPIPPAQRKSRSVSSLKKALVASVSVLLFILVGGLVAHFLYRRVRHFEVLEDWELESPHRFHYKDLYTATKGFRNTELIGAGGFGEVFKGILPHTGAEVAVKKISNNSLQGPREFAAEIECLGRLRHKNLVNLQGWCKYKKDLLLVYDYIPNGSLDSSLYRRKDDGILTWEQRFNIIKGVAAGLLYLHEEWEQVVIHRDVKSSNVLIDNEMNARLGDFGLARLYNHDQASHTTLVVGTIGYIAPELTRVGKVSTSSDVYAFGVLLLEIACGKPPISYHPQHGQVVLMDLVFECLQLGQILDAADPKLSSHYAVDEMELVLGLGLLCSHPKQEVRPGMRQVLKYLNGDEAFPIFDKLISLGSRSIGDVSSGYSAFISTETVGTSYGSISAGKLSINSYGSTSEVKHSTNSFGNGR